MKINTHWFCFAIAFAGISLLPVLHIKIQPNSPRSLNILATGYFLHSYNELHSAWILFGHLLVASVIAIAVAAIIQRKFVKHKSPATISLRHSMALTAIVAAMLAALTHLDASVPCKIGALAPFAGYAASTYLTGLFAKEGISQSQITEAKR